jgi:glutamate decarboxylase
LAKEIAAIGPFEMLYAGDPADGIPALCWTIAPGKNPGYSLYDLADRLRVRGWQVPAYSMPAHREDLVVQRILVRLGVSRDLSDLLLADIKAAIDYLSRPTSPIVTTAFHH